MRMPSRRSALAAIVSIVSIALVVHWAAGQEPPHLPQSGAGYLWLALAVAVTACAVAARAWRWHRIMRLAGVAHRRRDAAGLTVVGYMGNNVLPARGGELLKVGLLGARSPARHREVLGTVVVERVLDAGVLVALFAILTWAGVAGVAGMDGPAAIAATAAAVVAAAGAVYLALRRRGLFGRFAAAIRPVAGASRLLITRRGVTLTAITLAIWALDAVTVLLAARSVGVELSPLPALAVLVLGSLAAAIPAAPGYVGTFDAAFLLGAHAAGVKGGDAVSVLLMTRFVLFGPVTVAGVAALVLGYRGLVAGASSRTTTPRRWARAATPGRR
jgi:glycosyltransferase 2 family protein